MSSFLKRSISAILALGLLFAVYYYFSQVGLVYFCLLLSGLAAREYSRLALDSFEPQFFLKALFYTLCLLNYYFSVFYSDLAMSFFTLSALFSIIICFAIAPFKNDLEKVKQWSLHFVFGLIYCGLLPSFAGKILLLHDGIWFFSIVLFAVFSGDTLAYIVGVNFGRNKILPLISPKKTVEGSIGGLLGSLLAASILGHFLFPGEPLWFFVLMGLVLGLFGQTGDFFESLLKRINGVKDSGRLMPGHGGVLDRVDSLLFATPVMYFIIIFFD